MSVGRYPSNLAAGTSRQGHNQERLNRERDKILPREVVEHSGGALHVQNPSSLLRLLAILLAGKGLSCLEATFQRLAKASPSRSKARRYLLSTCAPVAITCSVENELFACPSAGKRKALKVRKGLWLYPAELEVG